MSERPTFITSNPSKAEQLSWHLGIELNHMAAEVPEMQSLSLAKVVEYKAKAAYEVAKGPVLVEDTSLVFHALGKLPGPLIKWFLQELDNGGLCQLLNGYSDRSATASVIFGYYDGGLEQTSYCYLAKQVGEQVASALEEGELAEGMFEVKAKSIDDAIALLSQDKPDNLEGKFIQKRDIAFLQSAREQG